jgi:hypothetical protein
MADVLPQQALSIERWLRDLEKRLERLERFSSDRLAYGSAAGTYPGGSNFSNQITIAHSLGVIPVAYVALSNKVGQVDFTWVNAAADATNLYLKMANPFVQPAGGTTCGCFWLAIA